MAIKRKKIRNKWLWWLIALLGLLFLNILVAKLLV